MTPREKGMLALMAFGYACLLGYALQLANHYDLHWW
jgi:hypothetical protein